MISYPGKCHCGAIGYEYHCVTPPGDWPIRACQCTFCRRNDAHSTSLPDAEIHFLENAENALIRYRFGLKTADFLICRRCGIYIGAVIETPSGSYGIINTRSLDPQPPDLATANPISYDSEGTRGRISRRESRWAPVGTVP